MEGDELAIYIGLSLPESVMKAFEFGQMFKSLL